MGLSPNSFGLVMATRRPFFQKAPGVRRIIWSVILTAIGRFFDAAFRAFPGLQSMSLHSTYLSLGSISAGPVWIGRNSPQRRKSRQRIAANHWGPLLARAAKNFLRSNIATPRARVEEACDRLRGRVKDLAVRSVSVRQAAIQPARASPARSKSSAAVFATRVCSLEIKRIISSPSCATAR